MSRMFSAPLAELFQFQLYLGYRLGFLDKVIDLLARAALELCKWFFLRCHMLFKTYLEPMAGIEPATYSLPWSCSAD